MKSLKINLLIGLAVAAMTAPVMAETQATQPTQNQKQLKVAKQAKPLQGRRVAARNPNSVNSNLRAEGSIPQTKEKDFEISIGVLAGYAMARSSDAGTQNLRDQGGYARNGYGGLNVDLKVKKYFGIEAEGFYGAGQNAQTAQVDRISGTISQNERKLSQYGAMGAAKLQVPISVGRGWIAPKVGVGYGMLTVNEVATDTTTTNETESKLKISAPYGLIGVDTELLPRVILSGDFAMSFGATGTQSATTASTTTEVDTASAEYYRIRLGLYYRFTPSFTAGVQFNRRQLKYTAVGSTTEATEGLNQYLGAFAINF